MIAREKVHLHAHVGQLGDFPEESCESFGHHIPVLIPEIEHVAQQIDSSSLVLDAVKKAYEPPFLHASVLDGKRSQMGIG